MNKSQFLKWVGEKILFGFVFGIGLYIAIEGGQWAEKKIKPFFYSKSYVQYSGGSELEIIHHADIRDMREYIIGGQIRNNTQDPWKNVQIEVSVFKNQVLVDTCRKELWWVAAETTDNFSLVCSRIFPERLTDEYTYKIEITYATRRV